MCEETDGMDLYLALGSNLGDRKANLDYALAKLDDVFGKHEAVSAYIETEPWGFDDKDMFLNTVARYIIRVPRGTNINDYCHWILRGCKAIEYEMGRRDKPEYDKDGNRIYHSRIIDIDILMLGDVRIDDDDLKIPHPLMMHREFVLLPLREIYAGII